MKLLCLAVVLSLFLLQVHGQTAERHTIRRYVKEAVSGESLIGVNIYLPDLKTGTVTNNYGFYSITLPSADSVELVVSYVGFTPEIVKVNLRKDIELNIDLKPNILLNEVTVTADRKERQSESVRMSSIKLQVAHGRMEWNFFFKKKRGD